MRTVAVTGRSGSGKSSISAYLVKQGYPVCDADQVARQVLLPGSGCIPLLQESFGEDIIAPDGSLRRRLLADRAFKTPEGTQRLTDITHPAIQKIILKARDEAEKAGSRLFFIDGAVIVGTAMEKICDDILLVYTPYEVAVNRICARDGIEPAMARRRLDAQMPLEALQRVAGYQLCNDGPLEEVYRALDDILSQLLYKE